MVGMGGSSGGAEAPASAMNSTAAGAQNAIGSPRSPVRSAPSSLFPPPRTLTLSSTSEEGFATTGKNPSTLNHTLLFSKMYDGISAALSEHASTVPSRVHSPTQEAQDLLMRKTGYGLYPVEINAFQGAPAASPPGITTSIFQSAFAAFGPSPSPMEVVSSNSLGSILAANVAADAAQSAAAIPSPAAFQAATALLNVTVPESSASSTKSGSGSTLQSRSGRPSIDTNAPSSTTSSSSGAPPSNRRQMSLNLLSKSDFERRKPRESSRLGMVITHVSVGRVMSISEN